MNDIRVLLPAAALALMACINCNAPAHLVDKEKPKPVVEEAFAFPGAEGFGRNATGGRGGRVIFVTNLNDAGEGSLRAAIDASGPRYILFKVSGTIALQSDLKIRNNDITIAGQTAPGDGICLRNYQVTIDADNVIIRFLRFRMGDTAKQQGDALGARFHKDIIVDHCSMSWSTDECVSVYNNERTTVQWCIIGESLRNSVHFKGAHGYGGIWGGKQASFHHNLLAHHDSRNPRLGEEANSAFALTDLVDLRNNVLYNWGANSTYGGEGMNVNIVNCYYKPGPATLKKERIVAIDKNKKSGTAVYDIWGKYYIDGNYMEGSPRATADNWTFGVVKHFHDSYGTLSPETIAAIHKTTPHNVDNNINTHTAQEAYTKVLQYGGASLKRDAVDQRIIDNVRNGNYLAAGGQGSAKGVIDSQTDVGGWPELASATYPASTSADGMPDSWKKKNHLDPSKAQANGRDLSTAYDNIEVYINSLVEDIMKGEK